MRIHKLLTSQVVASIAWAMLMSSIATSVAQEKATTEPSRITPDIVYGHKDGMALTMDLFYPTVEPNGGAILFMVSGGWFSKWSPPEQFRPLFDPYLEKGYRVFAVRHGSSPRYSIPEAVSDVRQAVRFVRKNSKSYGIEADRLGVMGMSAGGHLALMLGTTGEDADPNAQDELGQESSRVAAVVAMVPPTDLSVAVWESPESLPAYKNFPALNLELEKAKDYSPLTHVTTDDAPSLVIMGGRDELVPQRHGKWISEAFEKVGVKHKLIVYPEAGHGLEGVENRANTVREALAWFDGFLLGKSDD